MKYKKVKFTESFLIIIDEILKDDFSTISREDFLSFFYFLEHCMSYNDDGWAQFCIANIRDLFGRYKGKRKLTLMINILLNKKVIETTPYHFDLKDKSKSFTRKYKYTDEFYQKIISEEINFLTANISYKTYSNLIKNNIPTEPHLLSQYNLLKGDRFKIDILKASQWLLDQLKEKKISPDSFHVNQRIILSLDNKDGIYVKKDEKTGRVFTNFVCMKKELRQFCTIDNKVLNSIDLKCAQPTFLANFLIKKYSNNGDVIRFCDIIFKEDIYKHLIRYIHSKELYEEFKIGDIRDQSKVEFMRWLFSDAKGNTPYGEGIKKEFPDVWNIVQENKKIFKKNGTNFAIELQKIEAKIFVEGSKEIIEDGVLTVHDSLFFKDGFEGESYNLLKSSLEQNQIFYYQLSYVLSPLSSIYMDTFSIFLRINQLGIVEKDIDLVNLN